MAGQPALEKRAIERARRLPVAQLQPGLPKQELAKWISRAVGPEVTVRWEVNDCGESSGDPRIDRARDMPMCAAATADLPGGWVAIVSVVMGTFGKGIGTPQLHSVNLGKDSRFESITRLGDLPGRIQAIR